jgi:hypothetical protein
MKKFERKLVGLAIGPQLWRLNDLNLLSSLAHAKPISKAEAHRSLSAAEATGLWKKWSV